MHLPAPGDIHDRYLALDSLARDRFQGSLAGKFLLCSPFDSAGIAVVLAAGLAGAASLCLAGDPEQLREALRHGLCDFVVADLGEALRILKNELRRRRAVSVGIASAPEDCLAELLDRGVQPDLISLESTRPSAVFLERGSIAVPAPAPDPAASLIEWSAPSDSARTLAALAQIASDALDETRSDTPARRHWLAAAPRHLGRAFRSHPCVRMTPAEAARFDTLRTPSL